MKFLNLRTKNSSVIALINVRADLLLAATVALFGQSVDRIVWQFPYLPHPGWAGHHSYPRDFAPLPPGRNPGG